MAKVGSASCTTTGDQRAWNGVTPGCDAKMQRVAAALLRRLHLDDLVLASHCLLAATLQQHAMLQYSGS